MAAHKSWKTALRALRNQNIKIKRADRPGLNVFVRHMCHLHVQGHQWFTDTMKIDAKAHGKPLGQVSNLTEILPAVVLRKHL